jgi:hypothetical protein
MLSMLDYVFTADDCPTLCSSKSSRQILFRLTNLAFNPSIVHLLSDALFYSTEALVQVRRRLLHGLHERE